MLSSQPVYGLSGLGTNRIVDTPAAFSVQPYCHLLRREGTASLFAFLCIFCTILSSLSFIFCLSVIHLAFALTLSYILCPLQATGQGREGLCVLTGRFRCGRRCRLFSLDQQLHVAGSQDDLFCDIHTVTCRIDISHSGPILHITHNTHSLTYCNFTTTDSCTLWLCHSTLCWHNSFVAQVKLELPLPARPWDVSSKRGKIWKDRRDEVVTAGNGERTGVEGCSFSIIQSDNMPLSWNSETLPDSLELGRLAGKRIMQDDGICHNLHCPGKIQFDRAMHGGACHVPRAGHRGSLAEMIFAICASVVKASQPICQKMWGRDSWRQQGILPNAMKNHALPSLFIHRPALVRHSTPQQTILLHLL